MYEITLLPWHCFCSGCKKVYVCTFEITNVSLENNISKKRLVRGNLCLFLGSRNGWRSRSTHFRVVSFCTASSYYVSIYLLSELSLPKTKIMLSNLLIFLVAQTIQEENFSYKNSRKWVVAIAYDE